MEKENKAFEQQREYERQYKRAQATASNTPGGNVCRNCGVSLEPGAKFCGECGAPQEELGKCPNCGAEVEEGRVICPACGKPCATDCTYCGAQISAGDTFCPECGNPRHGIVCPDCGTLNFRSFCRRCNRPLNAMALEAVERVRNNPHVKRAREINEQLDQLEIEIERLEKEVAQEEANLQYVSPAPEATVDVEVHVSDKTKSLLDDFASLIGESVEQVSPVSERVETAESERKKAVPSLSISEPDMVSGVEEKRTARKQRGPAAGRLEQLRAQYQAGLAELQKELDAMIPDPNLPPESQRNVACAMKYSYQTVRKDVKESHRKTGWRCNKCHILHPSPSDCGVREYGGKWEVQTVLITTETTINHTGSLNF